MFAKQIGLDTLATLPYTCVVSSHRKSFRRVNCLMSHLRRNAKAGLSRSTLRTAGHPTTLPEPFVAGGVLSSLNRHAFGTKLAPKI